MKKKENYFKVGLVLTALTLLPLAHPAMAGDEVPYKGKEVGAVTKGAFQFPFSYNSTVAEGEATYIGHYTLTGNFVVDVRFGTATGSFTADNQFGFAVNLPVSLNPYVAEIEGTISTLGANKQ